MAASKETGKKAAEASGGDTGKEPNVATTTGPASPNLQKLLAEIANTGGVEKATWLGTDKDITLRLSKVWWTPETAAKYNLVALHGYMIAAQEMVSPKYGPFIGVLWEAISRSIGEDEAGQPCVIEPGDQVLVVATLQLQSKLVPAANDPVHIWEGTIKPKSADKLEVGKGHSMWTYDAHIFLSELTREDFQAQAQARLAVAAGRPALGVGGGGNNVSAGGQAHAVAGR